jgi:hypothetical protein
LLYFFPFAQSSRLIVFYFNETSKSLQNYADFSISNPSRLWYFSFKLSTDKEMFMLGNGTDDAFYFDKMQNSGTNFYTNLPNTF